MEVFCTTGLLICIYIFCLKMFYCAELKFLQCIGRQDFPYAYKEQDDGCRCGSNVCDWFGVINSHNPEESRQDDRQRNEQKYLSQQCEKDGDFSLSQSQEDRLASVLQSEDQHSEHINRHHFLYQI